MIPFYGCHLTIRFNPLASLATSLSSPTMFIFVSNSTTQVPFSRQMTALISLCRCQNTHGDAVPCFNPNSVIVLVTSECQSCAAARVPYNRLYELSACVFVAGLGLSDQPPLPSCLSPFYFLHPSKSADASLSHSNLAMLPSCLLVSTLLSNGLELLIARPVDCLLQF